MATNLNVVGLITIKAKTEGVPETISGIKGVDAAYQSLEKSTTSAGTATVTETKHRLSLVNVYEREERRVVAVAREQYAFNRAQKIGSDFARQFPEQQERVNAFLAATTQRYGQISQATAGASTAASRWTEQLVKQREKFDPLFAAGNQYKKTLTEINQSIGTGALTQKQAAAAIMETKVAFTQQVNTLRGVREANDNAAASTQRGVNANRLASHELVNLSRQAQDVVVSLGSGQSFGTVLLQQGTQIADVFANSTGTVRGLFSQIEEGAQKVFTPMVRLVTGTVAIGGAAIYAAAAWSDGQREITKALSGIGAASGVTRGQINKIAESGSSAFGLSISEARGAAVEFASTGKIYEENIKSAVALTKDYARATGTDAADASKALAKALVDPVAGALELNKSLGFLDGKTLEYIRTLENANQHQEAQKVLMDAVTPAIKRQADQVGVASKAWDLFTNSLSKMYDQAKRGAAVVGETVIPGADLGAFSDEQRLSQQKGRLSSLQSVPGWLQDTGAIQRTNAEIERLQGNLDKAAELSADTRFRQFSLEADKAVKSLIPQIEQIQNLEKALADLNRAKEPKADLIGPSLPASEVRSRQGLGGQNEAATRAIQVQLLLLKESTAEADRYNQRVLQIAASYSGVGVSTALVLDQQKQQLAVAEASGTGRQLEAQEAARINELLGQRKSLEEATRTAAGERQIAQAQINAGAREQLNALRAQLPVAQATTGAARMRAEAEATVAGLLRSNVGATIAMAVGEQQLENAQAQVNSQAREQLNALRDQAAGAAAVTGEQQIQAAAVATVNQLLRQGVDIQLAMSIAAQQTANAQAKANAAVDNQIHSLEQQTELIYAKLNGEEASVKAAQAYANAMRDGADATHAAAIEAAVLANEAAKAEAAAAQDAESRNKNRRGVLMTAEGANAVVRQYEYEQGQQAAWKDLQEQFGISESDYNKYKKGGTTGDRAMDRVISGLKPGYYGPLNPGGVSVQQVQKQISGEDQLASLKDAFDLIGKTGEEKAKIESQQTYKNLIRDGTDAALAQAIANQQLQNAMADLKTSVDANTESQLDAIYTQGHAALKIGYYGEGSGGGSISATDWGTSPSNPAAGPVTTGPNAPNVSTPWPTPVGGPGGPNILPSPITTPDQTLNNPNIPHPGMVWVGAGIAGGSWVDANSPWAHVSIMAEGGVIPPHGLAYVGEHGPNPRFMRAGSEAITVTPHDLTGTAYLRGDSHTWYGPGGARWDDRSGSVAPPWYPSTPEARGWSHSSPSNVIPFPGITGAAVDPNLYNPNVPKGIAPSGINSLGHENQYWIPFGPAGFWSDRPVDLSHMPQTLAAGGTIPPYGMAYVGEHGPNPRFLQAGGSPITVTPNEPAKQDNQRAPPQQITIINNNFPPGSVFGDRRTRRQSAEGFGRAIAAYQ